MAYFPSPDTNVGYSNLQTDKQEVQKLNYLQQLGGALQNPQIGGLSGGHPTQPKQCPCCGYCPHCGRSNPNYPSYPNWQMGQSTCESKNTQSYS